MNLSDFTARLQCEPYGSELRTWAANFDRTLAWQLLTLAPYVGELTEVDCKEYLGLVADALLSLPDHCPLTIPNAARGSLLTASDNGIRSLIELKTTTRHVS